MASARAHEWRRVIGVLGVIVATLAVASGGSSWTAVLFGVGVLIVWIASAPAAFAAAHLGLLVVPGVDSFLVVLLVEIGLLTMLVAPMLLPRSSSLLLLATAQSLLGLLVVLYAGLAWTGSVWGTAVGLLALAVLAGSIIDRHERIQLGEL